MLLDGKRILLYKWAVAYLEQAIGPVQRTLQRMGMEKGQPGSAGTGASATFAGAWLDLLHPDKAAIAHRPAGAGRLATQLPRRFLTVRWRGLSRTHSKKEAVAAAIERHSASCRP